MSAKVPSLARPEAREPLSSLQAMAGEGGEPQSHGVPLCVSPVLTLTPVFTIVVKPILRQQPLPELQHSPHVCILPSQAREANLEFTIISIGFIHLEEYTRG